MSVAKIDHFFVRPVNLQQILLICTDLPLRTSAGNKIK